MEGITSFDQVFERFKAQGFQVGPHKAFQIARDASRVHIILLSEMDPLIVRGLLLTPASTIEDILPILLQNLPADGRIAVLPIGPITIPVFNSQ